MATRDAVFVVDLLALAARGCEGAAAVDALFRPLFDGSRAVLVVGYGVAGDVARMAASLPQCASLGLVRRAVDLESVARTEPALRSLDCRAGLAGAPLPQPEPILGEESSASTGKGCTHYTDAMLRDYATFMALAHTQKV